MSRGRAEVARSSRPAAGHENERKKAVAIVGLFVAVYLMNTSHLADPIGDGPVLPAHRGLAQGFERKGLTRRTCTAARMLPRAHDYLDAIRRS